MRAMGALQTAVMVRSPKNARARPSTFIVRVCRSYGCDQLTLCCFCPAAPPTVYVWKQHVCATAQPGCDGVRVREGDRSGESKHFITVEWRRTLQVSSLWVNALETRKMPPLYLFTALHLPNKDLVKKKHPGKSCVEGTAEQQFLEFESVFLWSSDKLKLPGIWQCPLSGC